MVSHFKSPFFAIALTRELARTGGKRGSLVSPEYTSSMYAGTILYQLPVLISRIARESHD